MRYLTTERLILLSFISFAIIGVLFVLAAAAKTTQINSTTQWLFQPRESSDGPIIRWNTELFNLSPDVAFPGTGWLSRISDASTVFVMNDQTYTSAYEALVGRNASHFIPPCRNINAWLNSFILSPAFAAKVITACRNNIEWSHFVLCYLRNFFGAMIVYYGTAGVFHFFCYVHPMSEAIFEKRTKPEATVIWDQIQQAQLSMFMYVLLPVLDEYLIEQDWTRVYFTVAEIGGPYWYAFYTVLYFAVVEVGIYWVHRTLHTNKWLYKHIHVYHHKYNTPQSLTPWASIAFHPLDGILQASPYVLALFLVPCHYLTHFVLIFFTAIWATYIHDSMDWNVWPIMGSKYHTIHHTHYIYNYGQVFIFCDRFWGTFREPTGPTGVVDTERLRSRPVTSRVGNRKGKLS